MHKLSLFFLLAVFAVALAEAQYYVPRAYYTIDAEGHESARVPLRRLRRSVGPPPPYPYNTGANANADARAKARDGGNANARAIANAQNGNGGWAVPRDNYGASKPGVLRSGETRRQFGLAEGRSVSANTNVGVDSSGLGYYDQTASVSN